MRQAWYTRNEVAATYNRGIKKAKKKNRERFMEEANYLIEHQIYTLSDFEQHISSMENQIDSSSDDMKSKQKCMQELRSLLEMAEEYKSLKPVFDEMRKDKYRFKKAKEKYQAEHQSELTRFFMVRRKLKEAGYENEPFLLQAWEKELKQISSVYSEMLNHYKGLRNELNTMYRIKGDIDMVIRENGIEKTKEQQWTQTAL